MSYQWLLFLMTLRVAPEVQNSRFVHTFFSADIKITNYGIHFLFNGIEQLFYMLMI